MSAPSWPFRNHRAFLPVLHLPFGLRGAMDSAAIAFDAGADGVFLIDQGMTDREVLALAPKLRAAHPGAWIGVNLLGWDPGEVSRAGEFDGVWSDDAGVDALDPEVAARAADRWLRARDGWPGLYFGGTAFKTQRPIPPERWAEVGRAAAAFVDVVTTSGPGTGRAASIEKVRALHDAVGDRPLALASGVTPDNVEPALPFVRGYLVATGIEAEFGRLDPVRTRVLANRIHGVDPPR
ncbi:MAG: hypothetical protein ABMA64_15405 [Myxococcota bacterium]